MKFKTVYALFALILSAFFLLNNANGRATVSQVGNTGAPGEGTIGGQPETCLNCHATSAAIQVTLDIIVTNSSGQPIAGYTPDDLYDVKVRINKIQGNPIRFGFQLTALTDSDNKGTNSFSSPSANAKLVSLKVGTVNERQYAEQKTPSTTNEFTLKWKAPAAGKGAVTFYSAGNGVNLNMGITGDNAAKNSLKLQEGLLLSTAAPDFLSAGFFPNPASDVLWLEADFPPGEKLEARFVDVAGRAVLSQNFETTGGKNFLNIAGLKRGVYFLQLVEKERGYASKTFKVVVGK